MELTMIIIAAFLVLSERPPMVNAGGGKIISNPANLRTKIMTTDSQCILDHFAPRINQNSLTKLHQLVLDRKSLVCLAANSDTTAQAQFAIAYDIGNKIPVMTFKSFHCTRPVNNRCPLYTSGFREPGFLVNNIDGSVSTNDDIKGDLLAFALDPNGVIQGVDNIERGHLLSRELGAGLQESMLNTAGMEATYNMVNVIPQFRNSNQHGVWRRLEDSAVERIRSCVGRFYLVTGIEESQNYREYACGEHHRIEYKQQFTALRNNCVVRQKPSGGKRPAESNLSFPEKMWIAGCCHTGSDIKIYYGEAKNDYNEDTTTQGQMIQFGNGPNFIGSFSDFNRITNNLFRGTVCYKT